MKRLQATKTVTIEIIEDVEEGRDPKSLTDKYGRPYLASYKVGERIRVLSSAFDRHGNVWINCGMCSSPIYADLFKIIRGRPLPVGQRFDIGDCPKKEPKPAPKKPEVKKKVYASAQEELNDIKQTMKKFFEDCDATHWASQYHVVDKLKEELKAYDG